jgi:hypothetical protein
MWSSHLRLPQQLGGGGVDGQPASQILLRLVLGDVEDFEVRGPLNAPEAWSERRYSTCVLLSSMVMFIPRRRVVVVVPRTSLGCATSRSHCSLNSGGLTPCRDAMVPIIFFSVPDLILMSSFARSVDGALRVPPNVDGVS